MNAIAEYRRRFKKVLGGDANASDYIRDFVHSDNKRFKGKSKDERINMALGAYYGKRVDALRKKLINAS
jgi:hypothetical protein